MGTIGRFSDLSQLGQFSLLGRGVGSRQSSPDEETTSVATSPQFEQEEDSFIPSGITPEESQGQASITAGPAAADEATSDPETDETDGSTDSSSTSESAESEESTESATGTVVKGTDGEPLTEEELQVLEQMQERDEEVRRHEMAHVAAAGQHANGGPSYSYESGPDGKRYVVDGHVNVDIAPVAGDPGATIQKMQQVRRAALAPAEPSSQDRAVAAQASQQESQARVELAEEQRAEFKKNTSGDKDSAKETDEVGESPTETSESSSAVSESSDSNTVDSVKPTDLADKASKTRTPAYSTSTSGRLGASGPSLFARAFQQPGAAGSSLDTII